MLFVETKATAAASTRKTAIRVALILAGLALLGLYVQRLLLPSVGLFHDDGVYLVTAKALASGQGYRIISLPTPIPQTKYPILFPAILAVVWKMFPNFPSNLFVLKLVPFLAALAWFGLVYRWYRREQLSQIQAITLTSVMAFAPWVVFVSSTLLSETLFFALTMAALLLIRRLEKCAGSGGYLPVWAGALAGAATLSRMVGIALIIAGTFSLLRKNNRGAALFLAASLAVCLPWFAWTSHNTAVKGSQAYYTAENYGTWNVVFNYTPEQKLNIEVTNLAAAIGSFGSLFEYRLAGVAVLIALALLAGFILDIRAGGFTSIHVYCISYFCLILLWAWMPLRFLVVLTPLLLLFALRFIQACQNRTHWRWLPAGALLLAGPMLAEDLHQLQQSLQTGAIPSPGSPNKPPIRWREYEQIASWLRVNTPPDAVIMGTVDPVYFLYSGRASVRSFSADPYLLFYSPLHSDDSLGRASDLVRNLKRNHVTAFVSTPLSEAKALKRVTDGALALAPSAFHLALQLPDPDYRVYLVDPDRLPLIPDLP